MYFRSQKYKKDFSIIYFVNIADQGDRLDQKAILVFVVLVGFLVLVVRKVIVVIVELQHQTGNNVLGELETAKILGSFE